MPFRLQRWQPVSAAIIAVGHDQLRQAAAVVQTPPASAAAIHQSRVALKRVRALVALLADPARDEVILLDHALRDLGRSLAVRREAGALRESWQDLADHAPSRAASQFAAVGPQVLSALPPPRRDEADPDNHLFAAFAEVGQAWNRLPVDCDGDFIDRLTRSYRRARKQFKRLTADSNAPAWHELRQRAKRLQYQIEFLLDLNPDRSTKRHKRLQKLTDALGEHHDRNVLAERIGEHVPDSKARRRVLAVLKDRQAALVHEMLRRGRRVFDRKPGKFRKQWEQDWTAWQASPAAGDLRRTS
jgi:CHAD domain-containing protein